MKKRNLRRECFARLRALPTEVKQEKSRQIVHHLRESKEFLEARCVFSYLALGSEPDLDGLVREHPEKTWAFSRVRRDGERLAFHVVTSPDQLREGNFGFLEPDPNLCPEHEAPEIVLVPGVGFDPKTKARLGRGKGHYDRFLSPLTFEDPSLPRIGICFSEQLLPLETEEHDIPMTRIVSDRGWIDG